MPSRPVLWRRDRVLPAPRAVAPGRVSRVCSVPGERMSVPADLPGLSPRSWSLLWGHVRGRRARRGCWQQGGLQPLGLTELRFGAQSLWQGGSVLWEQAVCSREDTLVALPMLYLFSRCVPSLFPSVVALVPASCMCVCAFLLPTVPVPACRWPQPVLSLPLSCCPCVSLTDCAISVCLYLSLTRRTKQRYAHLFFHWVCLLVSRCAFIVPKGGTRCSGGARARLLRAPRGVRVSACGTGGSGTCPRAWAGWDLAAQPPSSALCIPMSAAPGL